MLDRRAGQTRGRFWCALKTISFGGDSPGRHIHCGAGKELRRRPGMLQVQGPIRREETSYAGLKERECSPRGWIHSNSWVIAMAGGVQPSGGGSHIGGYPKNPENLTGKARKVSRERDHSALGNVSCVSFGKMEAKQCVGSMVSFSCEGDGCKLLLKSLK